MPPADIIFRLASLHEEPAERYQSFLKASELGFRHPHLLQLLGHAAFGAGDDDCAEQCGRRLLNTAEAEREAAAHTLDWEKGKASGERAREQGFDRSQSRAFAHGRSHYPFYQHMGHTLLGLVACKRGDLAGATEHLLASAQMTPSRWLINFGPSLRLLRAVLALEQWSAGLEYLKILKSSWHEPRADEWLSMMEAGISP